MGLFRKTAKADLVVYNCTIYSSVGEKPFFELLPAVTAR